MTTMPQAGVSPLPMVGPRPRDELAAWSNAKLADTKVLAPIPGLGDPPTPGAVHQANGRGIFVRRTEGPAGGAQAWYIHGLAGSSTNWDRMAAALSGLASGFSPDLPGSGRSDPPPRGGYSLRAEADLIASLIVEISGGPIHLVGNSLGGVVATRLASRHPELVRSLTLISPAVPDLRLVRDRGADPRLALLLLPGTAGAAEHRLTSISPMDRARGMAELCFGRPEEVSDVEMAAAEAELRRRAELPWAHRSTVDQLRALIRDQIMPRPFSFAAAARRITVPVLVVWGTRDKLVDVRLARRTAAAFRQSRLLVLPGAGHVPQMECPAPTARAIAALWADADLNPDTVAGTDADTDAVAPAGSAADHAGKGHAGAPRASAARPVATWQA